MPREAARCFLLPSRIQHRRIIMDVPDMRHDAKRRAKKSSRTGVRFTTTEPSYDGMSKNSARTARRCVGRTDVARVQRRSRDCAAKFGTVRARSRKIAASCGMTIRNFAGTSTSMATTIIATAIMIGMETAAGGDGTTQIGGDGNTTAGTIVGIMAETNG